MINVIYKIDIKLIICLQIKFLYLVEALKFLINFNKNLLFG